MKNHYSKLIAKLWKDSNLKKRFLENPKKILQEEGFKISDKTKVFVHENNDNEFHFILPQKPELSDEELEILAGGGPSTSDSAFLFFTKKIIDSFNTIYSPWLKK